MLAPALKRELEMVIETALMLAQPGSPVPEIAERLYDSEKALMEQIQRPLIVERLTWMMNRRRQYLPSQDQMMLPGFPKLPERVTLLDGRRPRLWDATLPQLKQFRKVLMKRRAPRLKIIERLIDFMAPYAVKHPNIRVGQVVRAEAKSAGA
jgi:hypothetical protein